MNIPKLLRKNILIAVLLLFRFVSIGQVEIKGTVYDRSQLNPMQGVSVMGTSGVGTVTDSLGHYSIKLPSEDSIYFSYLGKSTSKFPVKEIPFDQSFDMSLQVDVQALPFIYVRPRNYYADSLENRIEYQKIFEYGGGKYLENTKMNRRGGMGVGIDMGMLFEGKSNRRMLAFQQRLEKEEQDKYVDHRFTKPIVKKITGLQPPALDTFMRLYRPSYEFVKSFVTEYEYYKYISDCAKSFSEMWKQDHP